MMGTNQSKATDGSSNQDIKVVVTRPMSTKDSNNEDVPVITSVGKESIVNIKELQATELPSTERKDVTCDWCMYKYCNAPLGIPMGISICIQCELYLCQKCTQRHHQNGCTACLQVDDARTIQERLFASLLNETNRKEKIKMERVLLSDVMNFNHYLDKYKSELRGMCGIDNNMLVICDSGNKGIKLINLRSRALERYIRFDAQPYGVTLIDGIIVPLEPDAVTDPDLSVEEESLTPKIPNMSILHNDPPNTDRALAVTFPYKRQIIYIDINKIPATQLKTIKMDVQPYKIDFLNGYLYVLCYKWTPLANSLQVHILNNGITLKRLDCKIGLVDVLDLIFLHRINLCVFPERIYIIDRVKHTSTVTCMDTRGKRVDEDWMRDENIRSMARGLDNNLYYCTYQSVCKCSADRKRAIRLIPTRSYSADFSLNWFPRDMCYYRDKLYLWQYNSSGQRVAEFRLI